MISLDTRGDWSNTLNFFDKMLRQDYISAVEAQAQRGVEALMKATHVIFQSGSALFMASILAGTYTKIPNTKSLQNQITVITRAGGKVVEWKNLAVSKSNKVGNIAAFGKEVK